MFGELRRAKEIVTTRPTGAYPVLVTSNNVFESGLRCPPKGGAEGGCSIVKMKMCFLFKVKRDLFNKRNSPSNATEKSKNGEGGRETSDKFVSP